jgi:MoxR-like ATPase
MDMDTMGKEVERESLLVNSLRQEMGKVIVGQRGLMEGLLVALLCNHHVLIEGVPGLAKTLAVTTLARTISATFKRIQFTPDLLPGDLIGTLIYNPKSGDFTPKKGPILAKVQSALLEAMQECQVTIGDTTYPIDRPFMVLATQNPVEQEGTYPLPEAQVDRFMLKLKITYPARDEELQILKSMASSEKKVAVEPVITPEDISRLRTLVDAIYMDDRLEEYIVNLVTATRCGDGADPEIGALIRYGASPRATIFLAMAARAKAFLEGRAYVTPQDIKSMAPDVLRHRLILTYEAEAEEKTSEDIIRRILDSVEVP